MSITWNGVSSDTIGVIVERIPNRYVPTRRFSPQQVAGRNGNILLVDKAFPNVEQEYEVYLSAESQGLPSVARACAEWLMGPDGYCRLTDSYDTTVYREAFLMGGFDIENILNKFGRCTITFSCKPQKYLLTGDTPISIPAGSTTTYTGSSVQFDGITGVSITSLSTTVTPTQDLHGYANPWPEGGGKNIYNPSWASPTGANSTVTVSGEEIHVVTTGGTTYSGMLSQSAHDLPAGTYYVKFKVKTGAVTGTGGLCGLRKRSNNTFAAISSFSSGTLEYSFSVTTTEPCYFSVLGNGGSTGDSQASDFTLYDLIISTEDVDYEPYSNICPITGRTSAKIYRFGKNLFNKNGVSSSGVTITQNSSGFRIVSNANGTYKACYGGFQFQTLDFPDGTEVTFSAHCKVNSGKARLGVQRVSDNNLVAYSSLVSSGEADLSLTYTYDKSIPVYLSMFCTWSESEAGDVEYTNVQLEIGSTVTSYEPYAGDTYTEDWTSVAGTVYGGTLDVVTGVLTVDNVAVTINGSTVKAAGMASYGTLNRFTIVYDNNMPTAKYSGSGSFCLSDKITPSYNNTVDITTTRPEGYYCFQHSSVFFVSMPSSTITSIAQANSWFAANTPMVCYELATPLTYQLTAQEIGVLVGTNYVWLSDGDVSLTVTTPLGGIVTNPTPFEARPLLEVSGVGEITINGKSIQILESVSDFDIDCESMEAEDNSKIYCMDFPYLECGENEIVGDGSITALTVTPRWWTL